MRITIFIVKSGYLTPPRTIGGVWFRTYEDAVAWIVQSESKDAFKVEKWIVPAYADGGGTPYNEPMLHLGVGENVNAWEKE